MNNSKNNGTMDNGQWNNGQGTRDKKQRTRNNGEGTIRQRKATWREQWRGWKYGMLQKGTLSCWRLVARRVVSKILSFEKNLFQVPILVVLAVLSMCWVALRCGGTWRRGKVWEFTNTFLSPHSPVGVRRTGPDSTGLTGLCQICAKLAMSPAESGGVHRTEPDFY